MSVPAPREPRHDSGRWDVILSALDSWPRALRLCLILLVTIAAPVAAAVVAELIRHMLLCENSAVHGLSTGSLAGAEGYADEPFAPGR
jgi:hypothetical protein